MSYHCSLSILLENIRKPEVFCFQRVQKFTIGMKWGLIPENLLIRIVKLYTTPPFCFPNHFSFSPPSITMSTSMPMPSFISSVTSFIISFLVYQILSVVKYPHLVGLCIHLSWMIYSVLIEIHRPIFLKKDKR